MKKKYLKHSKKKMNKLGNKGIHLWREPFKNLIDLIRCQLLMKKTLNQPSECKEKNLIKNLS